MPILTEKTDQESFPEMTGQELYTALQEMAMALMARGAPPSGIAWAMLIQGVQASAQMGIPQAEVRLLVEQALHHAYSSQTAA